MDGDISKMLLISRQETINPISQDVIDDKVFHEKKTKTGNELKIVGDQTLSNPGQVVQEVLEYPALSQLDSDVSSSQGFQPDSPLPDLHGQSTNFPKLPTYEEALTLPSLEQYLKDNPMTEEIRKVLEFPTNISSVAKLPNVNVLDRSLQSSFDFPEQLVMNSAVNNRDIIKAKLRTKLGKRDRSVTLDPFQPCLTDVGSRISTKRCRIDTPPYTFFMPKQRKPPDKLLLAP
ncbi:hypothetical protein OS493_020231 [Desmophyllum pertusum]|uniref:Uncharacterized protein n=1 Tax=Desmophyllum pertusum TaxID=174260 RepID=A0A9W9ZN00_9CNID|nr:hypothetical protein OS493_020231 [Desmophyllum pertusum]